MSMQVLSRFALFSLLLTVGTSATAQQASSERPEGLNDGSDETAVLEIAQQMLAAISSEDPIAMTDLMIEGGIAIPTFDRNGQPGHGVRTYDAMRSSPMNDDLIERGFNGEARVSGNVATVWLPYDIYVNGKWSHCGADVFIMVRTNEGWRIAAISWSAVQPPACQPHPDGPPESANN